MVAYALQLLATFCEMLHLWRFTSNGVGFFFFDFLSELSVRQSQRALFCVPWCVPTGFVAKAFAFCLADCPGGAVLAGDLLCPDLPGLRLDARRVRGERQERERRRDHAEGPAEGASPLPLHCPCTGLSLAFPLPFPLPFLGLPLPSTAFPWPFLGLPWPSCLSLLTHACCPMRLQLFKGPKIGILLVIIIVIGNSALVFINKVDTVYTVHNGCCYCCCCCCCPTTEQLCVLQRTNCSLLLAPVRAHSAGTQAVSSCWAVLTRPALNRH